MIGERGFGGVVHLTVPVPSHHLPEAELVTDMSHNPVDNIRIVGTVTVFIEVGLRAWFLLLWAFFFRGSVVITMAP